MNADSKGSVRKIRRPAIKLADKRLRANVMAALKVGPLRAPCTVMDLSSNGASLLFEGPLAKDGPIWLIFDNIPPISAKVMWRKGNRMGLSFDSPQDWVHRFHKERFDPAAWLRLPDSSGTP
jgi:PilZ domain